MGEQPEDGVIRDGGMLFPVGPYEASEGLVFATFGDDETGQRWILTTPELACAGVITCSRCEKRAVQLDHCWPYEEATTLCAEHVQEYERERRQARRDLRERLRWLPEVERQAERVPQLLQDLAMARERIQVLEAENRELEAAKARMAELDEQADSFKKHILEEHKCNLVNRDRLQALAEMVRERDDVVTGQRRRIAELEAKSACLRPLAEVRPEVRAFAFAMEERLRANDHKRPWQELPATYLMARLREECEELDEVVSLGGTPEQAQHEAADVANFAMMVADNLAVLRSAKGQADA